ncbi:uncharacterized protein LOC143208479 [Lasioglossum baleicum]|uniref:uncharacterized protein LOC143208479 n=1 Tax=Lasioglossum baleicum TaxID=434251 RepID=UPI003FCDED44
MCSFNSLVNCIILVCLPMIFAGPLDQASSITTTPGNDDSVSNENRYPCARNQTVLPCNCSEACRGPCPSRDDVHHHDHNRNVLVQGMICSCDLGARRSPMRDDYLFTPGVGMHKFHTRSVTWNAARKICNEEGGHLAVINSKAEARVLMGIFNRAGLVKGAVYPDEAYIGMHDIYKEGDWVTILGDTLAKTGFTEWSDKWGGQPDNGGGQQNCGTFLKEGTLDDVQCEAHFPFFCELPLVSFEPLAAVGIKGAVEMSTPNSFVNCIILAVGLSVIFESQVTLSGGVLDKWEQSGDHWYKLHSKARCWRDALKICRVEGGYLAVVNNQTEADELISRFHDHGQAIGAWCQDAVYVGIHDQFCEGEWITIFNEPIDDVFHDWSSKWGRQPDNFGGAQNCGTLYRDGKLNDVPCTINLPFFCEKDTEPESV